MLYAQKMRNLLFDILSDMETYKEKFVRNPNKDFSRKRKIGFKETIECILTMEKDTVKRELMKFFNFSSDLPSDAAFNQQRAKILPEAFEYMFREFTKQIPIEKFYQGYRLIACDGSSLHVPTNSKDEETYCNFAKNSKGYNIMHLNAAYDLLNHKYVDAVIQTFRERDERKALCTMIDRYSETEKTIIIADRGYISFNIFAHAQNKGLKYLIRVKDINSSGFLKSADLPSTEEWDVTFRELLTHRRDKDNKFKKCRYISKKTAFDFLDNTEYYSIKYRVVRFKLTENTYECLITNLTESEFSLEDLKHLYNMRWGIETSFLKLKYDIGLMNFHALKRDYLEQEIWAHLLVYNFCEAIILRCSVEKVKITTHTKYQYQFNITTAIYLCRLFLRFQAEITAIKLESMIEKNILPVRLGRNYPRYAMPRRPAGFCYRTP